MKTASQNLLKSIVAATQSGKHVFTSDKEREELMSHQPSLIAVNLDMKEGDKVATKATEAGVAYSNGQASQPSAFEIDDNVPLPKIKRGGGAGRSKYPFDQLEIGQSFHVAATADNSTPEKTLASVVTTRNRQYATPDPSGKTITRKVSQNKRNPDGTVAKDGNGKNVKETIEKTLPVMKYSKKFVCRRVGADDPRGVGARVMRVDV